jgi:hypothetical protein
MSGRPTEKGQKTQRNKTHNSLHIPLCARKLGRHKLQQELLRVTADVRVAHDPRPERGGHVERAKALRGGGAAVGEVVSNGMNVGSKREVTE